MTLAARVRHDVVVLALRWIGILEDRALAGPDDVEDVGRHVTLGHGALPILVEVQVVHGIDVDVLQLADLRHVARCAVAHRHFGIVRRIECPSHRGAFLHVLGHGSGDPVAGHGGVSGFHRDGGSVLCHLAARVELEHRHIGLGDVLELAAVRMAGQAEGVVPVGRVYKIVAADLQRGRPRVQGVGVVTGIAGELFGLVAVMGGPAQVGELHGVRTGVGLVGPGVERPFLPVGDEAGCGFFIVGKECLEAVHARDEEPMAEGVLVVPIIGGFEYPWRGDAPAVVVSMALAAELIARLCGQVFGRDDLRLVGRLGVLRTRSVAALAGDVQVFVIPVDDDGLVVVGESPLFLS